MNASDSPHLPDPGRPSAEPLRGFVAYPEEEMARRSAAFLEEVRRRRSRRRFTPRPVPEGVVLDCVAAAATAPSGANRQPWHFCVVRDPGVKAEIRRASEAVERDFYATKVPEHLRSHLEALGTGWEKPFLEEAPFLVCAFARLYEEEVGGARTPCPYPVESASIALGFLLVALHHAGLATVPYTPHPMGFLSRILGRPRGEKGLAILPVGYPDEGAEVPAVVRRPLDEVVSLR